VDRKTPGGEMKTNSAKMQAFTMMDILTGMVVMSIVIAMVFYVMSATNGQVLAYGNVRVRLNEYQLMKADLKRQTERALKIESIPNGFRLILEAGPLDYIEENSLLLRKSEKSIDTLLYNLESLRLLPVAGEANLVKNEKLVSGIILKVNLDQQILCCYLFKDYGLTEPINQSLYREL
jgi:hypothetical protein